MGLRKLDAQAILTKSHYLDAVCAKGLLSHIVNPCDLPWHDDCLHFEENTFPATTAGGVQVCGPLRHDSIGRRSAITYNNVLDYAPLHIVFGRPMNLRTKASRMRSLPISAVNVSRTFAIFGTI